MAIPASLKGEPEPLRPGSLFDRYILLEQIGIGAAGIVFAAYDANLDRKVALKLVRTSPGRSSERRRARLIREAQSLARLSHPNVVPVYEVGEVGQQVFVAMEFIDGQTLREWQDEQPRAWAELLDKYLQAGRGLAAAHAADIIHRDFKPDNVLVGVDGRVRVLDFGLAAPAGDLASESSVDTMLPEDSAAQLDALPKLLETPAPITLEGRIMGTPAYMAPEQAEGHPTTARADQYSFCVAMWEALYGRRPRRGEVPRAPRRPGPSGEVPPRIRKALERGLDADPLQRFATVPELLDALEPPAALPGRAWALIGVLSLALVALGVGLLLHSDEHVEACAPRSAALEGVWDRQLRGMIGVRLQGAGISYAQQTWDTIALELDDWSARWLETEQRVCEATHLERKQSAELLDLRMACLQRQLEGAAAVTEILAGEAREASAAASLDEALGAVLALPAPSRCLRTSLLAELDSGRTGASSPAVSEARDQLARAQALLPLGQYRRAGELLGEVEAGTRARAHPLLEAELHLAKGRLASQQDAAAEAIAQLREAWFMAQSIGQDELALEAAASLVSVLVIDAQLEQAQLWLRIGEASLARAGAPPELELVLARPAGALADGLGNFEEALAQRQRTLELTEALRGEAHVEVAHVLLDLAAAERMFDRRRPAQRHIERAREIFDSELGPAHPAQARALNSLGLLLGDLGQHRRALELHHEALEILERAYADIEGRHRSIAETLNSIGGTYHDLSDYEPMRAAFERARALLVELFGPDHAQLVRVSQNLAIAHAELGELEAALEAFEQAERVALATLGPTHLTTGYLQFNMGELQVELGNHEDAYARYESAETTWRALFGERHELVGLARSGRAKSLHLSGQPGRALELQREALALREATIGADSEAIVEQLLWVGIGELELGRAELALELLERGLAASERAEGASPQSRGQLRFARARAQAELGKLGREQLREQLRRAKSELEQGKAARELEQLRSFERALGL